MPPTDTSVPPAPVELETKRRQRGQAPKSREDDTNGRISVNLNQRSVEAMLAVKDVTDETKTEIINKAVQLYGFLVKLQTSGGAVYVRRTDDAELERMHLIYGAVL